MIQTTAYRCEFCGKSHPDIPHAEKCEDGHAAESDRTLGFVLHGMTCTHDHMTACYYEYEGGVDGIGPAHNEWVEKGKLLKVKCQELGISLHVGLTLLRYAKKEL